MAQPSRTQKKIARLQRKVRFLERHISVLSKICADILQAKEVKKG